jgi:hypothetical protein
MLWRQAPSGAVRGSITPEGEMEGRGQRMYYVRRISKEQRIWANFWEQARPLLGEWAQAGSCVRPATGSVFTVRKNGGPR